MPHNPFYVKDCSLSLISTGQIAGSLIELRDQLHKIPISSLYYHFWGGRLRISFVHPEYHNDFANWAFLGLHDDILTERLAIVDPTEYPDLEELRKKVIDIVEERLDEVEYILWTKNEFQFHFLRSIIIVYDAHRKISSPPELKALIPQMTYTSIFYHFIDARRRTPDRSDDFSVYLLSFGHQFEALIGKIKRIDPYFLSLSEIRQKLSELFNEFL